MTSATNFRYEILRTVRNRRFFAVTLALPLVIFYAIASANRHAMTEGIAFPLYFMTGMAAYGTMFAVVSPGARIAADRSRGWTRQLRITPLRATTDLSAKVATAYVMALPTLVLLFLAGATLGVRLGASQWLEMTGLILVGLAPFVVMGFILGNVVPVDTIPAALGGVVLLFALFGGVFGRLFNGGVMLDIEKLLPSYWLVQAGETARHGGSWPVEAWIVIAAWTILLVPVGMLIYKRATSRA